MKRLINAPFVFTAVLAALAGPHVHGQEVVMHVTQSDAIKAAKEKVNPEYPPMARQLHLEGEVQLEAHIGQNGTVEDIKPLTGNTVLMNAAVTAVKRWKFAPFMSEGKPAKAVVDLSFVFKI